MVTKWGVEHNKCGANKLSETKTVHVDAIMEVLNNAYISTF